VAKILQAESAEAEAMQGDESKEEEKKEEMAKDEESSSEMEGVVDTGDAASRAEILAPGIDLKAKDLKVQALKKAYGTKDGKKVIETLTGGKEPTFDSVEAVESLFIAASELLKAQRAEEFAGTRKKATDFISTISPRPGVMTAEQLNEINAKKWRQA
jgi:hypothetical protein